MSACNWVRRFFLLLIGGVISCAAAEAPFSFEATPGQLPKSVVPRHYELKLRPDLEKLTTHGSLVVEVEVREAVSEITLNALELDITSARLMGPEPVDLKTRLDPARQTVALSMPTKLAPGNYRLALEFNGLIGEQAQGLFYVKYAAPGGRKVMLATQMEPADARRMFPCWDEPVFRATYDLTVVVPEKQMAVSNMPIRRQTGLPGGLKEVTFARTPPMSSYLVLLAAGELEELTGEAEGVKLRIITTEGKREQGRYALESTRKILSYYNRYFGIKYPLPKLDQIAVPGGFSGAMENWGAITYNESMVLFNPGVSSQQTRREIFTTMAHEIAHQWFGDLVTTAWWDNLWLNEGFATWMETKATDHFNPGWQMWLKEAPEISAVMSEDSRGTTHAIQTPVANESQAADVFDSVTYQKGEAVLRMFESYLGEEPFRRGVHEYLSAHLWSNSTTADLWEALEKVSGKPVKSIAAGWTEQPGLPLVTVKTACVNGRQVVTLEQQRFTVQDPNAGPLQWTIPIALLDVAHPRASRIALLTNNSTSLTFPDCTSAIKANAGGVGYYRVAYAPELWQRLRAAFNQLPAADRLNLLNDAWAMVEAERSGTDNYLDLVASLRNETSPAIWEQILATLELIDGLEQKQPGRAAFHNYACGRLRPQLQRLGWEPRRGETISDTVLRGRLILDLGIFGDQAVIAEARARFERYLTKPETLAADLSAPVFRIVGRYSDRPVYDRLHELARNAKGTEQRIMFYQALTGALDPELAQTTLALSLTDETVPQEATALIVQVANNGEQPEAAWDFARRHLAELLPRVDTFDRNNYVPSIIASFTDSARADELEAFVKANVAEDALDKARQTGEEIRLKAALKQRELPVIDRWVAAQAVK